MRGWSRPLLPMRSADDKHPRDGDALKLILDLTDRRGDIHIELNREDMALLLMAFSRRTREEAFDAVDYLIEQRKVKGAA